jgi:hypothetical protein
VVVGIQVLDGVQGVKELLKSLQGRDSVVLYLCVRLGTINPVDNPIPRLRSPKDVTVLIQEF